MPISVRPGTATVLGFWVDRFAENGLLRLV
jgi:hypothetical protein